MRQRNIKRIVLFRHVCFELTTKKRKFGGNYKKLFAQGRERERERERLKKV